MNILWITTEPPKPTNSGARILEFQRINGIRSKGHKIYILSLVNSQTEGKYESEAEKLFGYARYFVKKFNIIPLLQHPTYPYRISRRILKCLVDNISSLVERENIELIIAEELPAAMNLLNHSIPKVFKYYSVHNIEYQMLNDLCKAHPNPFKKIVYFIEALKMYYLERRIFSSRIFNAFIFLSAQEKNFVENLTGNKNIRTFYSPMGVYPSSNNTEVKRNSKAEEKIILFTGTMGYWPNVNGILWFVHNVWPTILKRVENIKLFIVGRSPTKAIRKIASNNITVVGDVDDISEYFQKADLFIIPIFEGTGAKIKLFEALSYRKAVVSTSKGIKGTDFKHGKHLLIADDKESFAEQCILVLNSIETKTKLGFEGYNHLVRNYAWPKIINNLEKFLFDSFLSTVSTQARVGC